MLTSKRGRLIHFKANLRDAIVGNFHFYLNIEYVYENIIVIDGPRDPSSERLLFFAMS